MRMRKKRHGSERLLALFSLLYPDTTQGWINPAEVFGNDNPLKLEVGCGKGDFITTLSQRDADFNYLALERVSDVAVCAVEKYAHSRGLGSLGANGGWLAPDGQLYKNGASWDIPAELRGNVRFIVGEANDVVSRMPDHSLAGILANFSDPWSRKCTYEKRRLTHPVYLENYRRVLTPDGLFSFKTDDETLFDYTVEMLPACGFEIVFETRDLHASCRAATNIVTEYERNFVNQGIRIKMLEASPVRGK
ncbi:MAG: tRNA (guanosine(46)-N7)-methyltransferase TrmB [Eubacteriales bacterium]